MNGKHIAFAILPNHPHLGPTLPIVSVLVRRGHRVTYATSDRFASRVSNVGAEVLSYKPSNKAPDLSLEDWIYEDLVSRLDEMRAFYDNDRPDLLVYDHASNAARILAKEWHIPAIYVSPNFALERDLCAAQLPQEELSQLFLRWSDYLQKALARFEVYGDTLHFHRECLNVYLFSKTLQPYADDLSGRCIFAGRCPGEQPYYGEWTKPQTNGRPIALVGTSTNYIQGPSYFRMCIEALSSLNMHILLSIGDGADPASLGDLPRHVQTVQNVAHVKILPHVSLYICLGGIITSSESLYHGIPLLVTSLGIPEQEFEGENLARLGIAIHIRQHEMSAPNLREAARRILEDQAIHQTVTRMQYTVRREPGAEDIANEIEDLVDSQTSAYSSAG